MSFRKSMKKPETDGEGKTIHIEAQGTSAADEGGMRVVWGLGTFRSSCLDSLIALCPSWQVHCLPVA